MSSRWLRDFDLFDSGGWVGNSYYWAKVLAQFLHKVMDFTFQGTNCPAGRDYLSYEKNGTGGSFSGSSWVFTGSGFVQSDVGKYIALHDNTNPRNGGVYKIQRYISSTEIEINFQADPYVENPTASTGIAWWIWARTYESINDNDWVRLQSRHTTGWAIEINFDTGFYQTQAWIRVATNGNWTTGPIIQRSTDQLIITPFSSNAQYGTGTINVEGDYNGEWLHVFPRFVGNNQTFYDESWEMAGLVIARVEPLEPGHSDDELIVIAGPQSETYAYKSFYRNVDSNYIGWISAWSDRRNATIGGSMVENTAGGAGYGFTRYYYREPNPRINDKVDMIPGTLIVLDYNNTENAYQLLGRMKGHYTTKAFAGSVGRNGDTQRKMLAMTKDSYKDLLMIGDGWVIAWPGVTPQW